MRSASRTTDRCPLYPSFRSRQREWWQPDCMNTCHSSSYVSLSRGRTRPDTAAKQPSSMCTTISCVQWTKERWASFSSLTCPSRLKRLIIENCWTYCIQSLTLGALQWTGLSPSLWADTRSSLFVVSARTHACCATASPKDPS